MGYGGPCGAKLLFFICVVFSFMLLIWLFFPTMMDTVVEALDVGGYFVEYIL